MKTRLARAFSLTALMFAFLTQRPVELEAQLPTQSPLPGSWVAYGGGGSLTGALGVTAAVVSPPVGLRSPGDPLSDIVDASTSGWHSLIVRRDGSVWAIGSNDRGQLGLGYTSDPVESLTQIPGLVHVTKVVASGASSYAIDAGGTLWAWGDDSTGQLGIGQPGGALEQLIPAINPTPFVVDLDAGGDFAIAADRDGAIWSWGANADSQLGAPGPARNLPVNVAKPAGFFAIDVSAGASTALARSRAGDVIGWGSNHWHQLADSGETIDAPANVAADAAAIGAGDGDIVVLHTDGSVQMRGANWAGQLGIGTQMATPGFVTVPGLTGVVDVAAGANHVVAVTAGGLVYGWGFNHMRQLLLPTPDVFTATPQRALDVPATARLVRAKSQSTILLSDPGALAVHAVVPPSVGCAEPFTATISMMGFTASGGEPDQYFDGLQNIEMTLNVAPSFELAAPATTDLGTVTTTGRSITWSIPSIDASTATLHVSLRATGAAGEFALFDAIAYTSSFEAAPTQVQGPVTSHAACTTPDLTPPVISSVIANPPMLSPPNHQMVPVAIAMTAADNISTPVCAITGVTSNEPANPGESDWTITGLLSVRLKSDRDGHGDGRVYTIAVRCVDDVGNAASGSTMVVVPKGKKK